MPAGVARPVGLTPSEQRECRRATVRLRDQRQQGAGEVREQVTFQDGNPMMLTTEGEFVIKNLILLSAILVLYGGRRSLSPSSGNSGHHR
jgi:hypothetical protein